MKKRNNKGFVLLETLIVTVFISSVLIFLFVQFNSLNTKYEESNMYNKVEDLYALNNIANYIKEDWNLYDTIKNTDTYIDLSNCEGFTHTDFCKELLEKEKVEILLALPNKFDKKSIIDFDDDVLDFIDKINPTGDEKYRLIAKFKDTTIKQIFNEDKSFETYSFATIRFGDKNE